MQSVEHCVKFVCEKRRKIASAIEGPFRRENKNEKEKEREREIEP